MSARSKISSTEMWALSVQKRGSLERMQDMSAWTLVMSTQTRECEECVHLNAGPIHANVGLVYVDVKR